jgi:hypothetical protein
MATSSVIDSYLAELARRLPAPIVEELSDGVQETYFHFRSAGLSDGQAARETLAEFGAADMVVASFAASSPSGRTSRLLLAIGPLVGACWAAVLLADRAWRWPIPALGRAAFGAALLAVIGTLIAAAVGREYRATRRTAIAGCLGLLVLDAIMLGTVVATVNLPRGLLALAACASGTRIMLVLRFLPSMVQAPSW